MLLPPMDINDSNMGSYSMIDLPLELFQDIAQRLSKKDVKSLRSICRKSARNLYPILFDSVFLSFDPLDLDRAERIYTCFECSIKILIVCPVDFESLSERRYEDQVRTCRDIKRLPSLPAFWHHINRGYMEYVRVQRRASTWEQRTRMQELIRKILKTAPNLKKVVLTHGNRHIHLTDLDVTKYCHFKNC